MKFYKIKKQDVSIFAFISDKYIGIVGFENGKSHIKFGDVNANKIQVTVIRTLGEEIDFDEFITNIPQDTEKSHSFTLKVANEYFEYLNGEMIMSDVNNILNKED